MPGGLARLHRARELDGAAEQQQLLGERGLAGVGMRDDRKRAACGDGLFHAEHTGKKRAIIRVRASDSSSSAVDAPAGHREHARILVPHLGRVVILAQTDLTKSERRVQRRRDPV